MYPKHRRNLFLSLHIVHTQTAGPFFLFFFDAVAVFTRRLWLRFQSVYRARHSTETVLCWVLNEHLTARDDGQVSLLTLLDVSAAFGTTEHNSRVPPSARICFRHTTSALSFFQSYLTERKQTMSISGYSSNPPTLRYGVLQGSVVDPILFHLYTKPLSHIINRHSISHS